MQRAKLWYLLAGISSMAPTALAAEPPRVVVTIKPLHSLVAQVMGDVAQPQLLVKGMASPHSYTLKPSEARALNHANLFFRMSETVEPFTSKIVQALPKEVEVVTLQEAPGLRLLPLRTEATFERHIDKHHQQAARRGPAADATDGHLWLDPENAKLMVDRIEKALSAQAPDRSSIFRANAESLKSRIAALAAELREALQPVAGKPYIVFHDAFQYFERRFELNVVGTISITPDLPPSGKRLSELRQKIASLGAMCVFAEPQADRRLVENVIEGTSARTGTLDPEGGQLDPGPDLYFKLLRKLAENLRGCLLAPA
jgi:zinc transport system substrate-binding protein